MTEPPSPRAFTAVVTGRVQGVGFRHWARSEAIKRGLSGHIRNLPDGSVEVAALGDRAVLSEFLAVLRTGPPDARVKSVRAHWSRGQAIDAADGFDVRF